MNLPANAALLIRIIGENAAIRLMQPGAYGGQTVDFPKGEVGRGEQAFAALAEVVGQDKAKLLCNHFGGDRVYIPSCNKQLLAKRNRGIVAAYNGGDSVAQLVRDNTLSDRHIRNILKNTDMSESAQKSLF